MTGSLGWGVPLSVIGGLSLTWLAFVLVLIVIRPRGNLVSEAVRLLPDVVRLIRRLAADESLPRVVRTRMVLLLAYLAVPIDLVPDFIPILGYADDAIIVTFALRGVVRRAGPDVVRAAWPGTDDGFAALMRLAGLTKAGKA